MSSYPKVATLALALLVGTSQTTLLECLREQGDYVIDPATNNYAMPDDSTTTCFAMLVDQGGQSPSVYDDMSTECVVEGYNLEFKVARKPGFPAQAGSTISPHCVLSELPEVDCPNLD